MPNKYEVDFSGLEASVSNACAVIDKLRIECRFLRTSLCEARREHFKAINEPDFAPYNGICRRHNIHVSPEKPCNFDLLTHYGSEYVTALITGCPKCGSSYCD